MKLHERTENAYFTPFDEEDYNPDIARNIDRYYLLIDATARQLYHRKDVLITRRGCRAASQWNGQGHFMTIDGIIIKVCFHLGNWQKSSPPSPFALRFFTEHEIVQKYLAGLEEHQVERDDQGIPFVVLTPPVSRTLGESAEELADQVVTHVKAINALRQKRV